jgi:transcriptional regulator with XRE-family HTH domain
MSVRIAFSRLGPRGLMDACKRVNISRRQLALKLGISERQMARYAAGQARIPKPIHFAILYALEHAEEFRTASDPSRPKARRSGRTRKRKP